MIGSRHDLAWRFAENELRRLAVTTVLESPDHFEIAIGLLRAAAICAGQARLEENSEKRMTFVSGGGITFVDGDD